MPYFPSPGADTFLVEVYKNSAGIEVLLWLYVKICLWPLKCNWWIQIYLALTPRLQHPVLSSLACLSKERWTSHLWERWRSIRLHQPPTIYRVGKLFIDLGGKKGNMTWEEIQNSFWGKYQNTVKANFLCHVSQMRISIKYSPKHQFMFLLTWGTLKYLSVIRVIKSTLNNVQ